MRRLLIGLLVYLLLPVFALGEGSVINLIDTPDAPWQFQPNAAILEVWFPPIQGSDACVLRMNDEVLAVDGSSTGQWRRVLATLEEMGATRIDTAFNTHPHDDHLPGFYLLADEIDMGQLLITADEQYNSTMKRTLSRLRAKEIPIGHVEDGDVLTLGEATITVIQRDGRLFSENDTSAMLMVRYGNRSFLMAADVENRAQTAYAETPPACGLKADILKYPHHGQVRLIDAFYELIQPEVAIATATYWNAEMGYDYMTRKGVPMLSTAKRFLRLRTDGTIWVLDALPYTGI